MGSRILNVALLPAECRALEQRGDPHIVMVVPRGEAVRNFLYSDTLKVLSENARVTLLSVVDDERFIGRFRPYTEAIIPLQYVPEGRFVSYLRTIIHNAHYRWLWSGVAKNNWEWRDARATTGPAKIRRSLWKGSIYLLANRPTVEFLSSVQRRLSWALRQNDDFVRLFREIKPDLVFNCSHIHGPASDLPLTVAHHMNIPTAGFIFSWDNLTSRSRIFTPYDHYLVWNQKMRDQLLGIYPGIRPHQVFITGTPQFDFHFKREFHLTREALSQRIGIDSDRPFILYTTGVAHHFKEEYRTVELVAGLLRQLEVKPRPQLVVRTYVKDTSPEMRAIEKRGLPDVVFPPVLWDPDWFTPHYEDLFIYTNLLRHASLGINAASTVSLELMMLDKPTVNLGFDPPGSNLAHHDRWIRHIEFDHYRPVAESGATMVARSADDIRGMLLRALTQPEAQASQRKGFIKGMFGDTLDGKSGERVAECLLRLATDADTQKH